MKQTQLNTFLNYANRRALSTGLAVVIALLLTNFIQIRSEGWIVIAAFLVCQTTRGTPLRQGMIIFFCLFAALFSSIILNTYLNFLTIEIVLGALMVSGAFVLGMNYPLTRERFVMFALFPLLVLIATLEPYHYTLLNDQRVLACIVGTFIGMFATVLIAPATLSKEFAVGLIPLLETLETYSRGMRIYTGRSEFTQNLPDKINVERALVANNAYPEWVFEIGFNPGLRSGFRYVLVNLDHAIEYLFSLSFYFNNKLSPEVTEKLKDLFNATLQRNTELFGVLRAYFQGNPVSASESDFTQDLQDLEAAVKQQIPDSLEFIDLSPDYLSLTAIVRDIKDLRQTLLRLIAALPST